MSHILQNSGFQKENKGCKEIQFSTTKFYCYITNPLQVIWINSANTNLCSAGADENSDATEKNGMRNNVRAGGNIGVCSTSVRVCQWEWWSSRGRGGRKSSEITENTHDHFLGSSNRNTSRWANEWVTLHEQHFLRAWRKISRDITKIKQGRLRQHFTEGRTLVGLHLIFQMLTIKQWRGTQKGMFSWMLQLLSRSTPTLQNTIRDSAHQLTAGMQREYRKGKQKIKRKKNGKKKIKTSGVVFVTRDSRGSSRSRLQHREQYRDAECARAPLLATLLLLLTIV